MTYSDLKTLLEQVCSQTYELEAPKGETRFVVISSYGARALYADDAVRMEVLRVQLDICWQEPADTLLADIKTALTEAYIPYSVEDPGSYDDDYMAIRAILQLEVL